MRSRSGETHYTSNYGLPQLREAIADHLERLYGVRYDPRNEIIVTIGVSEALLLATHALLDPGDEVLAPDPYYVAYQPCCVLAGGKFVTVPTTMEHEFRVAAEDLEAKVTPRTKAILIGYPCEPDRRADDPRRPGGDRRPRRAAATSSSSPTKSTTGSRTASSTLASLRCPG